MAGCLSVRLSLPHFIIRTYTFSHTWLPVSVIGTAVAFYVGFKNNQAYDRMWEARKIWCHRQQQSCLGMYVDGFVTDQFSEKRISDMEPKAVKKRLIYRHIGWLYALRSQLLFKAPGSTATSRGR